MARLEHPAGRMGGSGGERGGVATWFLATHPRFPGPDPRRLRRVACSPRPWSPLMGSPRRARARARGTRPLCYRAWRASSRCASGRGKRGGALGRGARAC